MAYTTFAWELLKSTPGYAYYDASGTNLTDWTNGVPAPTYHNNDGTVVTQTDYLNNPEPSVWYHKPTNSVHTIISKCGHVYLRILMQLHSDTFEPGDLGDPAKHIENKHFIPTHMETTEWNGADNYYFWVRDPAGRIKSAYQHLWKKTDDFHEAVTDADYNTRKMNRPEWNDGNCTQPDVSKQTIHFWPLAWFLPSSDVSTVTIDNWESTLTLSTGSNIHYVKYEDYTTWADPMASITGNDIRHKVYYGGEVKGRLNASRECPAEDIDSARIQSVYSRDIEIYNSLPAFSG